MLLARRMDAGYDVFAPKIGLCKDSVPLSITGNFSGILTRMHPKAYRMEIRRGFTAFKLTIILEEACHSMIVVEHDPMLYKDSAERLNISLSP